MKACCLGVFREQDSEREKTKMIGKYSPHALTTKIEQIQNTCLYKKSILPQVTC